jgi:hypothetical protein
MGMGLVAAAPLSILRVLLLKLVAATSGILMFSSSVFVMIRPGESEAARCGRHHQRFSGRCGLELLCTLTLLTPSPSGGFTPREAQKQNLQERMRRIYMPRNLSHRLLLLLLPPCNLRTQRSEVYTEQHHLTNREWYMELS